MENTLHIGLKEMMVLQWDIVTNWQFKKMVGP